KKEKPMLRAKNGPRRNGHLLIELMVALVLLVLIGSISLAAVQKIREAAARTACQNNLHQLGLAIHNYHDALGRLPPLLSYRFNNAGPILFHLLPYMEQDNLYRMANGAVWTNQVAKQFVKVYTSPLDWTNDPKHVYKNWLATASYAANGQVFGSNYVFDGGSGTFDFAAKYKLFNIPDGTSNTIGFATRYEMCNGEPNAWGYYGPYPWVSAFAFSRVGMFQILPPMNQCDPTLAQSHFNKGINVAMMDGSTRMVSENVSPTTWVFACLPDDGNLLPNDW